MLGNGTLGYTIPAEFVPGLIHRKGALAAARQGDAVNPTKASSSCQFYIVQGNAATPDELLTETAQKIINTTTKYCGGTGHIVVPEVIF